MASSSRWCAPHPSTGLRRPGGNPTRSPDQGTEGRLQPRGIDFTTADGEGVQQDPVDMVEYGKGGRLRLVDADLGEHGGEECAQAVMLGGEVGARLDRQRDPGPRPLGSSHLREGVRHAQCGERLVSRPPGVCLGRRPGNRLPLSVSDGLCKPYREER